MIIFGAGVIGEATLHACKAKGIRVECFVDDRIVGPLFGLPVIHSSMIESKYPWVYSGGGSHMRRPTFLLTSPNIGDMINRLESLGFTDWMSCGEVLRGFDVSGLEFQSINGSNQSSRYSIEHVKYLIRTCLHHHENYTHPERLTVQSVDLIVTERCSMKCRDCSNLMQYYERPENADLNEMFQTIDRLSSEMDEVYEVRVIGGEPFMNKEVHLVVEKLTSKANINKVSIFTNATILPREHQWEAFEHEKVRFFITEYDLSKKLQPLTAELERRGIAYVCEKANGWTDCASLEKHNRTTSENEALFSQCCAKNLATLAHGKLYRCPFSANAAKLQAVPDYKEDYLVVSGAGKEDIRAFLRGKTFINACDHCNGRSYGDKVIEPAIQTRAPLKYKKYSVEEIAVVGA